MDPRPTPPTLRTCVVAFGVEAPFVVLVPLAVLELVPEALRAERGWLVPAYVALRAFMTVALVAVLVLWMRPIERWARAEQPDDDLVRAAGHAAYRIPPRFGLLWAVAWLALFPILFAIAGVPSAGFAGAIGLVSVTLFCAALPLAAAMLGWLLAPAAGALSLDAHRRGLRLHERSLPLRRRLLVFATCAAVAPTAWMSALGVVSGVRPVTLAWFAFVAIVWAPVCAWFLASSVAWPIQSIAGLLERVVRGGPEKAPGRIPVYYEDELGALARSANDMTERLEEYSLKLEQNLRDLEAQKIRVEDALAVREEFLSIASHELRTPLTTLNLTLGRLRRMTDGEPHGLVERSLRQVRQLTSLVDDLLDVTRIDAGKLRLRTEDFDLDAMVAEVVEALAQAHPGRTVELARAGAPLPLHADRARLEQVVTNLVENAFKYSPPEGRISVRVWREEDRARISVRDEGEGIAPQDLERIFDRFYRVEELTAHSRGLGLGLYICRTLVEQHGGRIWAESTVGQGSEFHVSLPLHAG